MMKIFGITLGRKASSSASSKRPASPYSGAPSSGQMAPPAARGDMASNLSADVLMPETRSLLKTLSDTIGFGTRSTAAHSPSSPDSPSHSSRAQGLVDDKPPSEGMSALLKDLSRRLFPHRHTRDEKAVNPTALLEKLRDDLKNLKPKSISDVTPPPSSPSASDMPLDATAQEILARSNASLDDAATNASADGADTSGADRAGNLQGDTKPDHASKEALANPFSLVNINRGAASAIPIAPGADVTPQEEVQKKRSRRRKPAERTTVNYKKKLQQSRFSRRRFLREYGSNTVLGVVFSLLLLIGFTVGTIVTNVSVIIPQTRINQDAGKQSEAFRNEIDRNQPKLSGLLKRRQDLEEKLTVLTNNFVDVNQIRDDYTNFLNLLDEDPRVEVTEQTIESVENELPNIEAINVTFRVSSPFLLWLKYRNQMIRTYDDINVVEETITAPPGISTVNIYIKMSRPGRSS